MECLCQPCSGRPIETVMCLELKGPDGKWISGSDLKFTSVTEPLALAENMFRKEKGKTFREYRVVEAVSRRVRGSGTDGNGSQREFRYLGHV